MATNIFVYWSDGLGVQAFDHHSRNGGGGRAGHLPTKIVRWAGHLTNSNVLEAGFDSHITTKHKITHYN